jgi:hypothetical protein
MRLVKTIQASTACGNERVILRITTHPLPQVVLTNPFVRIKP